MKYISIDIETTGLDPENHEILSIGAIIEDTENLLSFEDIPKFHVAIKHEEVKGSLFALNMNRGLIHNIVRSQSVKYEEDREDLEKITKTSYIDKDQVAQEFFKFLCKHGIVEDPGTKKQTYLNVAGKNFGTFDKLFIEKLPRWKQYFKFRSRIIDPSILFVNWKEDESLPSLDGCKVRAKLEGIVTHNALEDAWDVVQLLRTQYA